MDALAGRNFFPSIWVPVAAVVTKAVAAYVAFIKVFEKKSETFSYQAAGEIHLERFQGTQLFRFVVKEKDGSVLTCLNFAVDSNINVTTRKVRGKTSGVLGFEVAVVFEDGFVEGYEKLVLRMPYVGDNGSAEMMGSACDHAARVVARGIEKLEEMEAALIAASNTTAAPATPAAGGGAVSAPGSGGSDVFSPMSIG